MLATSLGALKKLAREVEASLLVLHSLLDKQKELVKINIDQLHIARDQLDFTQKMDQRMSDADRTC
jgi:hypothetical protein